MTASGKNTVMSAGKRLTIARRTMSLKGLQERASREITRTWAVAQTKWSNEEDRQVREKLSENVRNLNGIGGA